MDKNNQGVEKMKTGYTIFEDDGIDSANITTGTGGSTFFPYPAQQTAISSSFSLYFPVQGYCILELAQSKVPKKVYLNGRLLSLGIFGSDVDVAFIPQNKLLIETQMLIDVPGSNRRRNISVEYNDWMYHYTYDLAYTSSQPILCKHGTKIIDATLVGMVAQ